MKQRMVRSLDEVMRDEMVMQDSIISLLKEGPKTIVKIAEALGYPSSEVTKWVMSMRRYGIITEMPKARSEDYYRYQLHSEGLQ